MNVHLKYCQKCGGAFDISTNHNICPKCRSKNNKRLKNGRTIRKRF